MIEIMIEIQIVKRLLSNLDLIGSKGLCYINFALAIKASKDLKRPQIYYDTMGWIIDNTPDHKNVLRPSFVWTPGDVDSRMYWLKDRLKELENV